MKDYSLPSKIELSLSMMLRVHKKACKLARYHHKKVSVRLHGNTSSALQFSSVKSQMVNDIRRRWSWSIEFQLKIMI